MTDKQCESENMKKVGRPTKLTQEMLPKIVELIKMGNYVETACAVEGINKTTYYYWLKKAHTSTEPNIYTKFRDEIMKAKAYSEARDVALISRAGEKSWHAAAWKLERKFPDKWGRQKLEVEQHPYKSADVSHIPEDLRPLIKEELDHIASQPKSENPEEAEEEDDFEIII